MPPSTFASAYEMAVANYIQGSTFGTWTKHSVAACSSESVGMAGDYHFAQMDGLPAAFHHSADCRRCAISYSCMQKVLSSYIWLSRIRLAMVATFAVSPWAEQIGHLSQKQHHRAYWCWVKVPFSTSFLVQRKCCFWGAPSRRQTSMRIVGRPVASIGNITYNTCLCILN